MENNGNQVQSSGKINLQVIMALVLVHFIGDFYMSFIKPLLPVLVSRFSLSMTQVGFLSGMSVVMAFIVQPVVGYMADRFQTRFFVLGGPLLSAIFIPLFGWAVGFYSLIFFALVGSIGQSMFHPPAAGMVPAYSGRHHGLSMALFILGGTLSFGIGPVFVTWFVTRYDMSALPLTMIFGILATGVLVFIVPKPAGEGLKKLGFWGSIRDVLGPVWKPLAIIYIVIVFRTFVMHSVTTFVPILFAGEGYNLVAVGGIISIFTVAGALSGVIAGHLADRIGYKPVFLASYLLASPSLYLFLHARGNWLFAAAFLAGFITLSTLPLATAMAQSFVKTGQSIVASLMMGVAFGAGGLLTPLTGKLADMYSIRDVLGVIIWIPLAATILILYLPTPKHDD